MRQRKILINLRVTEDEKKIIERKANKCGLSLSAYIRNVALGKEIKSAPSKYLYEAYQLVCNMNSQRLEPVKELLLKAYHEGGS